MNALLKYPGAKNSIAHWIIEHFPKHHSYLEPFFGSGGVFFKKPPSNIETVNDLDDEVINLFCCIREDPEKLAHAVHFTPYSRTIYDECCCAYMSDDPFEKAIRFLIRCNMAYGFRLSGTKVGWNRDTASRERAYSAQNWCKLPDEILVAAERLRGVQIECRPAINVIKEFNDPGVLIYCDPPYVLSKRFQSQYKHEMTDDDHEELLATLKRHSGPVLISGYRSSLYEQLLSEWYCETTLATDRRSTIKEEVLWMNFEPPTQLNLYGGA